MCLSVFFLNATATTDIYTLSLHDALPIFLCRRPAPLAARQVQHPPGEDQQRRHERHQVMVLLLANEQQRDRKSTRLNSSHANISYAVFCLKKKKSKTMNF